MLHVSTDVANDGTAVYTTFPASQTVVLPAIVAIATGVAVAVTSNVAATTQGPAVSVTVSVRVPAVSHCTENTSVSAPEIIV